MEISYRINGNVVYLLKIEWKLMVKRYVIPKNQCSTDDGEGNVVDFCKNFDDINGEIYFEGGKILIMKVVSLSQENLVLIVVVLKDVK